MYRILFFIILFFTVTVSTFAAGPLRVENVVRIKGQEETTIRAFGIVSGLNGTGDEAKSYTPLAIAILRQLERSGMSGANLKGIASSQNNALVEVTVKLPGTGARDGDVYDCTVVAVGNAKSLAGGVLSTTMLSTPLQQDENSVPLGMAQGKVTLEQASSPNTGRVVNGCRVLADFSNPYIKDGLVTLVIKKEYSHPRMANKIADEINNLLESDSLSVDPARANTSKPAKAITPHHVTVRIPTTSFADPMDFIARILDAEIIEPPAALPKVTINERAGTIAIDENVEVKPTLVTHKNFVADVAPQLAAGQQEEYPRQFLDLDSDMKYRQMNGELAVNMKLKALQSTMNSLRATSQDIIDVIKILQAQGAIVGEVEFVD